MRMRRAIFMSKVYDNSTPKMILGMCWGTRACDRLSFLAKPVVNSVIIFLSQMTLLRLLLSLLRFLTVILIVLFFWIYFFFLTLVFVLQWFSLHWEIPIMLLSLFPLTFHQIDNGMPCFIAKLMTVLVLIGMVFVIIWEMFHGGIYLNLVLLLLLVYFVSGFRLELMYTFLIENIRSSLTHVHGFELLVLLP